MVFINALPAANVLPVAKALCAGSAGGAWDVPVVFVVSVATNMAAQSA
ncbi:hypothetical protein [Mycobacterium attenuatum]|nr:hypothetical protein [Mycobacterium attenuatum]